MRLVAAVFVFLATACAAGDDARALLERAHAAFVENRGHARSWNWTSVTSRTIIDANGRLLEKLPGVTVESPIRSDGKRCNAVLAWGDGREPYLATASADERCAVEEEIRELLNEESILRSARVKLRSRSRTAIVLSVSTDHEAMMSRDLFARCTASVEGTLRLDPETFFPILFDLRIAGKGCEQQFPVVNHYDAVPVVTAMSTFQKGATVRWEYALQKDKGGNAARDYWICVRRHSVRPLTDQARVLIVWGRRFPLRSFGRGRRVTIDADTTASELAAEVTLKFSADGKQ